MQQRIEEIWRELKRKVPLEQIFYLSLVLAFCQNQRKEKGKITQAGVKEVLERIQGYNLRVAFTRIFQFIRWEILDDKDIEEMFQIEVSLFREYLEKGGKLSELFQMIFAQAGKWDVYAPTPTEVRKLIVDILGFYKAHRIADFCCGGAGLGLELWKRLTIRNKEVSFHGEELNRNLCDAAQLYFSAYEVPDGEIEERDILTIPDTAESQSYDIIVLDIPRGQNVTEVYDEKDPRLLCFNKKNIYSDWIFIQDVLYRLKKTGTAAVLVTPGALTRVNEEILREQIVVNDWLEAVITLPENLYSKYYAGTELLIFNKDKESSRKGKVIFIDISKEFKRQGRRTVEITEVGLLQVREIFVHSWEVKGVSAVCSREQIQKNQYSFKPSQYIQQEDEWEFVSELVLEDIAQITRGAQVPKRADVVEDGDVYFLNIKDIQEKRIQYEGADKVRSTNSVCKGKYRIQKDDILITSKGTALKLAIVEDYSPEAYISGNLTLIRVNPEKYHPYVLFEYLNSRQGQISLERIQSGTTIRILSNASLQKLKIPEYHLEKMREIGKELKENQTVFYREKYMLEKQYENKRKHLLKELEVL
ncbi:N-6 DNA methylase [Blautia hansenii]|uniref:N-6 DNA methylase n=1 Tax=Blautia hansenii TaxID=1322 RepID=UPI0022E670A3|nr:N-6 DNA methylase [Blautia hansenii]